MVKESAVKVKKEKEVVVKEEKGSTPRVKREVAVKDEEGQPSAKKVKKEAAVKEEAAPVFKPGQKYSTPAPANGDRVFYETLLKQNEKSEMAQDWCLAYGVLDAKESQKLLDSTKNRKEKKSNTPTKTKK